jgi:hypothetical protein
LLGELPFKNGALLILSGLTAAIAFLGKATIGL